MPLFQSPLAEILDELHSQASKDRERLRLRRERGESSDDLVRMGELYLAISPEEGRFLYMLVRAMNAKRIVEFGTSFGVSTLYLAAAAGDTGGHVFSSEVHPDKCAAVRATFDRAGLSDRLTLLEGDGRETLTTVDGPIDLLLLDGWKSMYLPVFDMLRPKMRAGALILADNWTHEAAADYMALVQDDSAGLLTHIDGDLAITCVLG